MGTSFRTEIYTSGEEEKLSDGDEHDDEF